MTEEYVCVMWNIEYEWNIRFYFFSSFFSKQMFDFFLSNWIEVKYEIENNFLIYFQKRETKGSI